MYLIICRIKYRTKIFAKRRRYSIKNTNIYIFRIFAKNAILSICQMKTDWITFLLSCFFVLFAKNIENQSPNSNQLERNIWAIPLKVIFFCCISRIYFRNLLFRFLFLSTQNIVTKNTNYTVLLKEFYIQFLLNHE